MTTLAQLLSTRRKEDGVSLREAAQRIGISHGYLNKLENGVDSRTGTKNNPTPETLQMIAAAYNWDYQYLLKICGYIDETASNNTLRPCIRKLIETCNPLSDTDIGYITKFAKFISAEKQSKFEAK